MKYLISGGAAGTASGSIGGLTYSHNRYGQYIRRKAIPVNVRSARQVVSRGRFTQGVIGWFQLTAAQRDGWNTYGSQVPFTDSLGQNISLTGQNMYIRTTATLLAAGLPLVTDAPVIYNTGDVDATLTITGAEAAAQGIDFTFDDSLDWTSEDDAGLMVAMSRPQSVTRTFNGQPTRLIGTLPGDSVTPVTSPQSLTAGTAGYTMSTGNVIRLACRIARADGRISTPFYSNTFTVTAT